MADTALAEIARWRANVAGLVTDCCKEWDLRAGAPYVPGVCGHVVRVELPDGTPAVLKVWWPHREARAGGGRARALGRRRRGAACSRATTSGARCCSSAASRARSSRRRDDPLGVFVELLPRLWRSGDGFRPLADEAECWIEHDCGRRRQAAARRRAPLPARSSCRRRASRCSCTRTCTARTSSPRSASRGS